MLGFPSRQEGFQGWKLDVVSILAVLGENNIKLNASLITSSWTCLLPRLIPAPQGLLEVREKTLPFIEDVPNVVGIKSGNTRSSQSFLSTLLISDGLECEEYTARSVTIKRTDPNRPLQPRTWGPLPCLAVVSFLFTVGLVVVAVIKNDSVALTGICLMSCSAPLLGIGKRWDLAFPKGHFSTTGTPETVVMRNRDGTFTIVHCDEDVARHVFFSTQRCEYWIKDLKWSQGLGGLVGGVVLIVSIIMFGNSQWTMQVALAVTYAVLNMAYWVTAILPLSYSWDTTGYEVSDKVVIKKETFTWALWEAIKLSGTTEWVKAPEFRPASEAWNEWLAEAQEQLDSGTAEKWHAQHALDQHLGKGDHSRKTTRLPDGAKQEPIGIEAV